MEQYPLQWPVGYTRTFSRSDSRFKQTMGEAQRKLHKEIKSLGATELIVSTNLRVRADGNIYAVDLDKIIFDPGVAIYFKYKGKDISMCCDRYRRVWENMYALAKGIESLRGMTRWGVSNFLERAFTGFAALPENTKKEWWGILGVKPTSTKEEISIAFRKLAKVYHPDIVITGDEKKFKEIYDAYLKALGSLKCR